MQICGWGRYPVVEAHVSAPSNRRSAQALLKESADTSFIPRGMGRSYGDSALASHVISINYLNLLLDFDERNGRLRCGAGVTIGDLVQVFEPRGWFPPVVPGTKFVTVAGAVASDIHGKNHHVSGCFSSYVQSLDLLLADGEIVTCSRDQHPELFHATCGGMGLTGMILEVQLQLTPIRSTYIDQTTFKARNLVEVLELFEQARASTYSVAWIDCLSTGKNLGRSLLMLGEHFDDGILDGPLKRSLTVPIDMPSALLNPVSIGVFNALYYHSVRRKESRQRVSSESFFFPLDRIDQWNRLYGKSGFVQYQFVIPKAAGLEGMTAILRRVAASNRASFLGVLKEFGPGNANPLSFPRRGYTLALDLKLGDGLFELLEELDRMVLDSGGRIYLAKDARMSEAAFKRGYSGWEAFQTVRESFGARGRFASRQSRRLGLD